MKYSNWIIFLPVLLFLGCMSTDTRNRVFTDDWAGQVRRMPNADRNAETAETDTEEIRRLGPAVIAPDETGRPRLRIGGESGVGVDFHYRGGPSARVRYRHQWDFGKPRRKKQ